MKNKRNESCNDFYTAYTFQNLSLQISVFPLWESPLFSVFFTCIWFFGQFYSKYDYIRNVNTFFDKASNWRSSHCEELFQSPLFFVFSVNVVSVSFFVLISYFPFLQSVGTCVIMQVKQWISVGALNIKLLYICCSKWKGKTRGGEGTVWPW